MLCRGCPSALENRFRRIKNQKKALETRIQKVRIQVLFLFAFLEEQFARSVAFGSSSSSKIGIFVLQIGRNTARAVC